MINSQTVEDIVKLDTIHRYINNVFGVKWH